MTGCDKNLRKSKVHLLGATIFRHISKRIGISEAVNGRAGARIKDGANFLAPSLIDLP
jgi:hypothetical protein